MSLGAQCWRSGAPQEGGGWTGQGCDEGEGSWMFRKLAEGTWKTTGEV